MLVKGATYDILQMVIIHVMFGAKLLREPVLTCCQLDYQEQTSVKVETKYELFIQHNAL